MSSLVGAEKQLSIVVLPVPNIPTSCKCVAASLCDPKGVNTFGEGSIDPRYRLFHDHYGTFYDQRSEAESKEKHGACDPMPELTITSLYIQSSVDSNTFTKGNPMPESTLTLCQSRLYPPVRDFEIGLWIKALLKREEKRPL
jgi:hypothetical protein